ncbi:uncharacterized protein [Amphiura filiformis]|uniref:uncharacterized protein n=1 Tax=Amphiura filiformis TaxID=82378 RepID=UPI003B225040
MYSRQFHIMMRIMLAVHVVHFNTGSQSQSLQPYYFRSRCADDQFQRTNPDGDTDCYQCSSCPQGHGVLRLCTLQNDTICQPCPRGSYSVSNTRRDSCLECQECRPHQLTKTECIPTKNRECRKACTPGYYFDNLAKRCSRCSYCYSTRGIPVRVPECKVEGVPSDYQCMIIGARSRPYDDHSSLDPRVAGQHHEELLHTTDILNTEYLYTSTNGRRDLTTTSSNQDRQYTTKETDHQRQQTSANISLENRTNNVTSNNIVVLTFVFVLGVIILPTLFYYLHRSKHQNVVKSCLQGATVLIACCLQMPAKYSKGSNSGTNTNVSKKDYISSDCTSPSYV